MQSWEYMVIDKWKTWKELEITLNALGREGWELVVDIPMVYEYKASEPEALPHLTTAHALVLKREKVQSDSPSPSDTLRFRKKPSGV